MKYLVFLFFLIACDSPMNHRIEGDTESNPNSQSKLSFQKNNLQVKAIWLDGPYGNPKTNNTLMVILHQAGELKDLGENLELEFWSTMPSMGHPMEDEGWFERESKGIYINRNIKFNMPRDWLNEVRIIDLDSNIIEKVEWFMFF